MKALTWQGKRNVTVEEVPDPVIEKPTDAIVKITSTAICGSDLHLYELFGPYLDAGDILGHEPMGVVVEVGSDVTRLAVGDRVVVPFNISCGTCFMCRNGLQSQCETTEVIEYGSGAALFGYTKLYGQVPGGQAEYLRVPLADHNHIKVGTDLPDDRYLFLSDILPTAWQGVEYANVPDGGTLVVMGLGPVGQFAARVGVHRGYRVLAVDPEPSVVPWQNVTASPRTSSPTRSWRNCEMPPTGAARMPSSMRSDWRRTATRASSWHTRRSGCCRPPRAEAHGYRRGRSAGRAARVHRHRPARRHRVDQRRVCRRGGHPADEDDVRQADHAANGAVQREALDRRPASAGRGSRRSASG